MSETHLPIRATLKAGASFDSPWVTVDAVDPADLETKMVALTNGVALAAVVDAANHLKGINNAAPLRQAAPAEAPQQSSGWGNSPAQSAPSWSGAQQQPPAQQGQKLHPDGETCTCGSVLRFKQVNRKSDGKQFSFWECPNSRSKDDGHVSKFAN